MITDKDLCGTSDIFKEDAIDTDNSTELDTRTVV